MGLTASRPGLHELVRATLRVLTFRASGKELTQLGPRHLAFGLFCTWLAGIGRWWDDPGAHLLLHLGLGSVIYVFVLATFLFLIIWPLRPRNWSWTKVLTYVSLTSPPALLYALPVERWTSLHTATTLNFWFLAVVAGWRVALLVVYLGRSARLSPGALFVSSTLPLMLIIYGLARLNLERAVFEIMAGLGARPPTSHDGAYLVLLLLTGLSYLGAIPMLIWYFAEIAIAAKRARIASETAAANLQDTAPEAALPVSD